jgi:predicted GNAT family N-acyltransferase
MIKNSTLNDLETIFELYQKATEIQIQKKVTPWPKFDISMVIEEINTLKQFKIEIDNQIACVWAIAFKDEQIWEERENNTSIYIHRIATNPDFKGQNLVLQLIEWAKKYSKENNKTHIRMDTVGDNNGLISYYTKCGFDFLGLHQLKNTSELPLHYNNASVSLFEIKI